MFIQLFVIDDGSNIMTTWC